MKKNPTKADLAAAVARLTQENAQMRDLLAAISLAAGTVPVSKDNDYPAEWKRSTKVLAVIKTAASLDDSWAGSAAWGAKYAREIAAEPVGYEVYQPFAADPYARERAEGDADLAAMSAYCPAFTDMEDFGATIYCDRPAGYPGSHHAPGPDEGSEVAWSDEPEPEAQECTDYDPGYKLHGCELGPHPAAKPHRDLLGVEWTESLEFPCPSKGCTLHLGHFPARHRDADGDEWTDAVYDASGPRRPQAEANPPHHAIVLGEQCCKGAGWDDSSSSGYVCTAQDGHDGDHVAFKPGGGEYHRWPAAAPEPRRPVYRLACGCTDWCNCDRCQAGKVHDTGTGWHCDEHGRTSVAGVARSEPQAVAS